MSTCMACMLETSWYRSLIDGSVGCEVCAAEVEACTCGVGVVTSGMASSSSGDDGVDARVGAGLVKSHVLLSSNERGAEIGNRKFALPSGMIQKYLLLWPAAPFMSLIILA